MLIHTPDVVNEITHRDRRRAHDGGGGGGTTRDERSLGNIITGRGEDGAVPPASNAGGGDSDNIDDAARNGVENDNTGAEVNNRDIEDARSNGAAGATPGGGGG